MKTLFILFTCMTPLFLMAQIGEFDFNTDIGDPSMPGSSMYDGASQTYTISGSGYNIWFERDEFQFLYNKMGNDFIATAEFEFVGEGTESHRKVGWMVRGSEDAQAEHFSATLHGDGLTVAQWRELPGAFMRDPEDEIFSPKSHYSILQIERSGDKYIMRAAHPGEPLQTIGHHSMTSMGDTVLLGLFICSHNEQVKESARIRNVRIDLPVAEDYDPGSEGWLGCRLEILDVFDGHRTTIYERDDRFEAPNWMPDGQNLLFNMDGALYKISVEGKSLEKINTGSADRLNNDHGISFDGKMIAISHHRDGYPGGGSTVYVLPIEGGEPKLITEETPSYWHGWAPNNEEVVYVAQRNGEQV